MAYKSLLVHLDLCMIAPDRFSDTNEGGFIRLHIGVYKNYNSGYNTEMINKQCNAGDPVETPGGLCRGPPSMLINVNTIKRYVCETLNQVQRSITMNIKLL